MQAIRPVSEVRAHSATITPTGEGAVVTETVLFNVSHSTAKTDGNIALLLYPGVEKSFTVTYAPTDKYGNPYNSQEVTLLSGVTLEVKAEDDAGPYAYELDLMKCYGCQLKVSISDLTGGDITYKLLY